MNEYHLWHIAMGGWFTNAGFYSNQYAKAATYDRAEAFDIARRHLTDGELGVIVVARADVREVLGDV